MLDRSKVLALIPARQGSKGLPGKNIRPLGGQPLLAWPIAAARGSRHVDRVIISTDSPEFAAIAVEAGAEAPFLRPAALAGDTASSVDVILHALDHLEATGDRYDYVLLLEPTSPLTESADVDSALEMLAASRETADAIVGVSPLVSAHPAFAVARAPSGLIRPHAAPDFGALPRRQDIEPLYALDGSLYVSAVASVRARRTFYHERTLSYVTPRWKSFEVDDLLDFICIEAVLANRELLAAHD